MTIVRPALLIALLGLWLAAGPRPSAAQAQPQGGPEEPAVEEIRKDFLPTLHRLEEAKDWKGLFDACHRTLARYPRTFVSQGPDRWVGLSEFLLQRLSKLPPEALQAYRFRFDGEARAAFDKARDAGSRRDLEAAVEAWFFSSTTDEVLDSLASRALDDGRAAEAHQLWSRLLRLYPDPDVPREVAAARAGLACGAAGDEAALSSLRAWVAEAGLKGTVRVAGKDVELKDFLATVPLALPVAVAAPARQPTASSPDPAARLRPQAPRNDIRRWTYDFAADRGEPAAVAPTPDPAPQVVIRGGRLGRQMFQVPEGAQAGAPTDFPILPAYVRLRGRDFVVVSDGSRVIALDPARVKGASATAGIYWKHPERSVVRPLSGAGASGRPSVGVAIDGEHAYVPMFSRLDVRPRDASVQAQEAFEATTSVKCIHIPTGRLVWDTDLPPLLDAVKSTFGEFYAKNFSFCGAPLVSGDRVFVGVCTSPLGEMESRVLCLDRRTGKPQWLAPLVSVFTNAAAMGSGMRLPAFQTTMQESGGTLYVQTNLGAVAALNPVSGGVLWLTRYRRAGRRGMNPVGVETAMLRPLNAPVVWKSRVFAVPQDRHELVAFDAATGAPVELPPARTAQDVEFDWRNVGHLIARHEDWLVLAASQSHVLNLKTMRASPLASSASLRTGRGRIEGGLMFLPVVGNQDPAQVNGGLNLYDIRTWRLVDPTAWRDPGEYGNVIVAGSFLVVAAAKVTVYAGVETLRAEYAERLAQSPPDPQALLEFAETLKENARQDEAADAFLAFIRTAEGDVRHAARVKQVRIDLHGIFLKRGDQAGSHAKALEHYAKAREFAGDAAGEAEAVRRLAQTYEKLERWGDAVDAWQQLVEKGRGVYLRESEQVVQLWQLASARIRDIVEKSPRAYADVERRAAEALEKAGKESVDGLRGVMEKFPDSAAAKDALKRMGERLRAEGRWDRLRSMFEEFRERLNVDPDMDAFRDRILLLEGAGDRARLRRDLSRFAERFGDAPAGAAGSPETVRQWVERRLNEIGAVAVSGAGGPKGPLKKVIELGELAGEADPGGIVPWPFPLRPLGVVPPSLDPGRELLIRGSSVVLWDFSASRAVWTFRHPGAWMGVATADAPEGVTVQGVRRGAPGDVAGLRSGDVLLSIDGEAVDSDRLGRLLAARLPGSVSEIRFRRGSDVSSVRVALEPFPASQAPPPVGAAFTRDHGLAVAWPDVVASVDLATGALRWSFRPPREDGAVRGFHATDGRLYVYETIRPGRGGDPLRFPAAAAAPVRQGDDADRLYCVGDATGEAIWVRAFEGEAGKATVQQEVELRFFGPYLDDHVRFLRTVGGSRGREATLWILDGRPGGASSWRQIPGALHDWDVDEAAGAFYYVNHISERGERFLSSLSLDPARKDFRAIEVPLQAAKYMPRSFQTCSLTAVGAHLVLAISPSQEGGEHRLWVFRASDGAEVRSLSLLPGRTLPPLRKAGIGAGPGDLYYVLNVDRDRSAPGAPPGAHLTAFRVAAPAGTDSEAWDALAPSPSGTSPLTLDPGAGRYVLLTASRAVLQGETSEGMVAVVYDRQAEGYVRQKIGDLAPGLDYEGGPMPLAESWRGRIYVAMKSGLAVFGD